MNFVEVVNRLTMGRALLLGVAIAAFYYFLFFDAGLNQKNQIASFKDQIQQTQKQIQNDQEKLDRAAVYKSVAAERGGMIMRLLSMIPENFKVSDLMRIVSNEAKVAGSSLASIMPKTQEISPSASEFEELTVSVEMNGSFMQHMVFLSNLTKVNQILVLRNFNLSHLRDARGEDPAMVKFVADIVAFRYRGSTKPDGANQ